MDMWQRQNSMYNLHACVCIRAVSNCSGMHHSRSHANPFERCKGCGTLSGRKIKKLSNVIPCVYVPKPFDYFINVGWPAYNEALKFPKVKLQALYINNLFVCACLHFCCENCLQSTRPMKQKPPKQENTYENTSRNGNLRSSKFHLLGWEICPVRWSSNRHPVFILQTLQFVSLPDIVVKRSSPFPMKTAKQSWGFVGPSATAVSLIGP